VQISNNYWLQKAKDYSPPNRDMKVVDLIAEYLHNLEVKIVFVVTGGAALHLIHSFSRNGNFLVLPMQHEQSGSMAADANARVSQGLGVSIATSGPGATNLLTGVCCSYYDGIPTLFLTGQVDSDKLNIESKSRQIGFQETNVVDIFRPITKYSKLINDAEIILFELDKAIHECLSGRPGPVLLDICSDIQRKIVNPSKLDRFYFKEEVENPLNEQDKLKKEVEKCLNLLVQSKKPLLILGAGIRQASQTDNILRFIKKFQIPYTTSWGAADIIPQNNELFVGCFGMYPGEAGNLAIQESDLLIIVGARLDKKTIGNDASKFGLNSKKIIIDIDDSEINKFDSQGLTFDLRLNIDIPIFLNEIMSKDTKKIQVDYTSWKNLVLKLKGTHPILTESDKNQLEKVNPYYFMHILSESIKENSIVITDCGSNLVWTMQGLFITSHIKRVISAWNHSPMGYSLPASIGACFSNGSNDVICITGDGGLQMNVQELATIQRHNLPIKIFVMNNHGHGIIQQGQDQYFEGQHVATNFEGGLPDPDYEKISKAYGIPSITVSSNVELELRISDILSNEGPFLCVIDLLEGQQIHN
jgi:acetolactate synthase-1/2/3 large subunit